MRRLKTISGTIEDPTDGLTEERAGFRELLNDPATLARPVTCGACDAHLETGSRAFALQDYAGQYVGYVCPSCHPNRKWINALWRSVLGDDWAIQQSQQALPVNILTRTVH